MSSRWTTSLVKYCALVRPSELVGNGWIAITICQTTRRFVHDGIGQSSVWTELRQQIYLGDKKFVKRMQKKAKVQGDELSIPHAQRRAPPPSIAVVAAKHPDRNDAIVAAYATGAYSYREIAEYFGLHLATVGRVIRGRMQQCEN